MENQKISEHEERLQKLAEIREEGINPYPSTTSRTHDISEVILNFDRLAQENTAVVTCGRLMSKRNFGNLIFGDLKSNGRNLQIAFSKKEIGADKFKFITKSIDVGDFLEVSGTCFITHKGEKSLMSKETRILTKAIEPLPEKWHGIKNDDERFRKRYLDIAMNDDVMDIFIKRSKFWDVTRTFLKSHGFMEVETPTIELTTGGAEANPFKTHHDDLDLDVYFRISVGELWQKRLMAAGFEKTFEIGRVYRNEGSSPDHLQEFTNMEFYWAYADYRDGMRLVKDLYLKIATEVFGDTKFSSRGHEFDLSDEWKEIDYTEEILKRTGIDILAATEAEMKHKLDELQVKYDGATKERLIDTLWKYCRKNISGPAFLINEPKIVSPLAKSLPDNPELTQRFHVLIAGSEIGNGYSELNDPIDQKNRFMEQKALIDAGDNEAMMPDFEFVEMLEHGMPPTCGFGFGERLFAVLCGKTVREATLFPLMRPKI